MDRLKICSDWGYPVDSLTLRLIVKDSLEKQGKQVRKFKNNTPGPDFVESFLKRHKEVLSSRMCQNIKRSRAAVSPEIINAYFDELEKKLKDVPQVILLIMTKPTFAMILVKENSFSDEVVNTPKE